MKGKFNKGIYISLVHILKSNNLTLAKVNSKNNILCIFPVLIERISKYRI